MVYACSLSKGDDLLSENSYFWQRRFVCDKHDHRLSFSGLRRNVRRQALHRVAKPATEHCHLASNGTISLKYHLVALVVLLVLKIVILSVCVWGGMLWKRSFEHENRENVGRRSNYVLLFGGFRSQHCRLNFFRRFPLSEICIQPLLGNI